MFASLQTSVLRFIENTLIMHGWYETAKNIIDDKADSLAELSNHIWLHPESNCHEINAYELLTDFLEENEFRVQRNYLLPTAFKAEFGKHGNDKVTVGIICEYNATPDIGHSCGHNLVAEAAIGAALGIKAALQAIRYVGFLGWHRSLEGRLVVLGSPAEEGGGKLQLLRAGGFDDVDFAMMVHPAQKNVHTPRTLASDKVKITYVGKEVHVLRTPWDGINALDAAISCYNNISQLRQHMKPKWQAFGVITEAGRKASITPGRATLEYVIQTPNRCESNELKSAVKRCFDAAALSSKCRVSSEWDEDEAHDELNTNPPLSRVYRSHAEDLGVEFEVWNDYMCSTDVGNISKRIPTIRPLFAIPTSDRSYTPEFAYAAGSISSQYPTLLAAKSMALTAIDLFAHRDLRKEVNDAFEESVMEWELD